MKPLSRNKVSYIKVLIVFILLIPFGLLQSSQNDSQVINADSISFYQDNRCEFNVFQLIKSFDESLRIDINIEPYSPVECFGKNSWVTYEQARPAVDDIETIVPEYINIWIFTNLHADLILQSIFWLVLISFIPKHKPVNFKYTKLSSFFLVSLFYLHLLGEKDYYSSISRNFDLDLVSREFSGNLFFGNFYLYNYLLILLILTYFLSNILQTRIHNLINFLPFIFFIYGTYSSLNINFYYILFIFLGINYLLEGKINNRFLGTYLIFLIFWYGNFTEQNILFDVDKVKGLMSTSQTHSSLFFWSISFFLFISGITYFLKENFSNVNIVSVRNNFIISATLITLFGILSALNYYFQFFTFYFLGLNKFGMYSLESITGNTWRGIAPSAEGMGEFFAFVILFCYISHKVYKIKLLNYQLFLILIVLYGLYRTNNFAAISSLFFLISFHYLFLRSKNKKLLTVVILVLFILLISTLIYFFNDFTYDDLSSRLIYNALQVSIFDNSALDNLNEIGQNQIEIGNFEYVLNLRDDQKNLSSTLEFLLEKRVFGGNIDNVPNVISIISIISFFINRAEKWGIFVAKYNPETFSELMFGYGPGQFTHYYLGHETFVNSGLVLPHSSILNYLIFSGVLGLLIIILLTLKILYNNQANFEVYILVGFLFLNILKSDGLLYLPNIILFVFVTHIYRYSYKK